MRSPSQATGPDYDQGSVTRSDENQPAVLPSVPDEATDEVAKRYPLGKPKRITIRARITHGQDHE